MIKITQSLILFLFLCLYNSVSAQSLVPCNCGEEADKKKLWGFCDRFYNSTIIKCQFDSTLSFSEGLGLVRQNGKYGFIDNSGKLVIPARFEAAMPFSGGFAAVFLNNKSFFIDKKGIDVFKKSFKQVSDFSDGLALCTDSTGKRGYIDPKGNIVIPFTLEAAYPFQNGMAPVRSPGEKIWRAINIKGETVFSFPDKVKSVMGPFSDELAMVYVDGPAGYNVHYDFINEKGEFICDAPYASAKPFKNGRAIIAYENKNRKSGDMQLYKYGLIKKGGREIVSAKYACLEESPIPGIYYYGNKSESISNCSGYGLVDSMGVELTKPEFQNFTRLNDTTFLCRAYNTLESLRDFVLLTIKGKKLTKLNHDKRYFIISGSDTLLVLYSDVLLNRGERLTSLYHTKNGLLKESVSEGLNYFEKQKLILFHSWQFQSGSLMTTSGKMIMDNIKTHIPYPDETLLKNVNYLLIRNKEENDFKLYNLSTGKFIISEASFAGAAGYYTKFFSNGLLAAKLKEKWGFIDSTGKFKIPARYESVEDFSDGWAVAEKTTGVDNSERIKVYINKQGTEMPNFKGSYASSFKEGFAFYQKPYESNDRSVYYINKMGKVIFKSENTVFYNHGDFSNGLAAVPNKEGKYGYINTKGELVIAYQFSKPDNYSTPVELKFDNNGRAMVIKDGKYIVIDKTGNPVR